MSVVNFTIRCPCCGEWTPYERYPEEVAVRSIDEFHLIMGQFREANEKGELFKHDKLLRCKSPRLLCPSSFEAIVYRGNDSDFESLKVSDSWSFRRQFRLYKEDKQSRWDNESEGKYCAILFNTQPVQRLRSIELETLMDRELVSRLISGMCVEIDTPLTFFAANIFEPNDKNADPVVHWVPIEGYSQDKEKLVPPRYNSFCKTCRDISMRKLVDTFNREKENSYNIAKCLSPLIKNDKCGEREAACMNKSADWDHCPTFLKERNDKCPCYNSDLMLIESVKKLWYEKNVPKEGVRHKCHAGFLEIAFPIEVHGHLVGVAMTGQFFSHPNDIKSANKFVGSKKVSEIPSLWSTLEGEEPVLDEARQILIGLELKKKKDGNKTIFLVDESSVKEKIERLLPNLKRFEDSAESHYRDFRARTEFAFRQELLGFVENNIIQEDFFKNKIGYILKRMQEFWAFKGVYLFHYSFATEKTTTIAVSILGETAAFGISQINGSNLGIKWQQFHPIPYLHFRGSKLDSVSSDFNLAIPKIQEIVDHNNINTNLKIKDGDCEFTVVVPTYRGVYLFVFAVRDQREVSSLDSRSPGTISVLCQDMIFETCCEIVGEFHNAREFVERDKRKQIECLETLEREIKEESNNISLSMDVKLEILLGDEKLSSEIKNDLSELGKAKTEIVSIPEKHICEKLKKLRLG